MNPKPLGSDYLLHEPIGRGAMGQVWRGSVVSDGTPVAIKVLRSELAEDSNVVARFHREGSIMVAISHPCVVGIREVVSEDDTLAIIMDLIEGGDLRAYLREAGTLEPSEALRLTGQVLAGLQAVHSAGILHRDLKPENVLIDTTGSKGPVARLTDFGIGRFAEGPTITKLTGLIGTPQYLAPEVIENGRATLASDLYSAGIVLYELLAGRVPFTADHPAAVLRKHLEEQPLRPEGLADDLWEFVCRLLEKDPMDRPSSATKAARQCADLSRKYAGQPALAVAGQQTVDGWTTQSPNILQNKADEGDANRGPRLRRSFRFVVGISALLALAPAAMLSASLVGITDGSKDRQRGDSAEGSLGNIRDLEAINPTVLAADDETIMAGTSESAAETLFMSVETFRTNDGGTLGERDVDWFKRNGLSSGQPSIAVGDGAIRGMTNLDPAVPVSYKGHPLYQVINQSDRSFLLYSDSHSEGWGGTRYLIALNKSNEVLYAYDFATLSSCGPGHGEPLDLVWWAMDTSTTLYLSVDCYFAAIDISNHRVIWQNLDVGHQGGASFNFVSLDGLLYSGTAIPDGGGKGRLVAIDQRTGDVRWTFELRTEPRYLVAKDGRLYVRTTDHEYVFVKPESGVDPEKLQISDPQREQLHAWEGLEPDEVIARLKASTFGVWRRLKGTDLPYVRCGLATYLAVVKADGQRAKLFTTTDTCVATDGGVRPHFEGLTDDGKSLKAVSIAAQTDWELAFIPVGGDPNLDEPAAESDAIILNFGLRDSALLLATVKNPSPILEKTNPVPFDDGKLIPGSRALVFRMEKDLSLEPRMAKYLGEGLQYRDAASFHNFALEDGFLDELWFGSSGGTAFLLNGEGIPVAMAAPQRIVLNHTSITHGFSRQDYEEAREMVRLQTGTLISISEQATLLQFGLVTPQELLDTLTE